MLLVVLMHTGLITSALADEALVEAGRYLTAAAGCYSCHTDTENDGEDFAGGHRLETEFGVFIVPNITPHEESGIGAWSEVDFVKAIKHGISPTGEYYYPTFPYASYAGIGDSDALAIKAYLDTVPPIANATPEHELVWWIPGRWAMGIWQTLFAPWEYAALPQDASAELRRGAYLVRHLGHCGECHTPRDALGALLTDQELQGMPKQEGFAGAPNITTRSDTGIGDWSFSDLELFLDLGMFPDGDFVGSGMAAVIDHNTSQLTPEDRKAVVTFLRSVAPEAEN
jgi:mono/diheme cytochrome c family protein